MDAGCTHQEEMGLSDITLVIHDFGSVLGYQFTYLYPTLVKRLISMDIGMGMVGPSLV